jgi:hypothetical protein
LVRLVKMAPQGSNVEFDPNVWNSKFYPRDLVAIGRYLTDLDPRTTYRLATLEEINEADPPITLPCVFNSDPATTDSFDLLLVKLGNPEERHPDCSAKDFVFVRFLNER